jgi:two-component system response regulator HydG
MNHNHKGKVLIVDDELNALRVLSAILSEEGYQVLESDNVNKAIGIIHETPVDAVITDLKMPERDGMDFFTYISGNQPDIPVIFLTAFGTVESAVSAMTQGAFYYFIKPPDYMKLKGILSRAIEQRRLKREIESLKMRLLDEGYTRRIIGNTPVMRKIFDTINSIRGSASSVLIYGETGTGKELIARALHDTGTGKERPFVAVNCAAMPRELIEAELFGYEKGAFTGAYAKKIGKFEEASEGIVFLDEIGEMELSLQSKLLRVLQEHELERLGSNKKISVNFRLISSTNRDLKKAVAEGKFREDLLYRINVIDIKVPPLRERKEDIPLFVSAFVNEFCIREDKALSITGDVIRIFQNYSWPGNVRQLRNVIERVVVLSQGNVITPADLPEEFTVPRKQKTIHHGIRTLKDLETQALRDALHACNGNKSRACKVLGISRKAFYKRLKDLEPNGSGIAVQGEAVARQRE